MRDNKNISEFTDAVFSDMTALDGEVRGYQAPTKKGSPNSGPCSLREHEWRVREGLVDPRAELSTQLSTHLR